MKNLRFYSALLMSCFVINSAAQIKVTQSGTVGIGTTNPYSKLQVIGNSVFLLTLHKLSFRLLISEEIIHTLLLLLRILHGIIMIKPVFFIHHQALLLDFQLLAPKECALIVADM